MTDFSYGRVEGVDFGKADFKDLRALAVHGPVLEKKPKP